MDKYKKKLEDKKQQKIKNFLSLGVKSSQEVAKQAGYKLRAVNNYAKENGVRFYKEFRKYGWTEYDIDNLLSHAEQTPEQIGEKNSESRRKRWRDKEIWTTNEVASMAGISYYKVRAKIEELGVRFYESPINAYGWKKEQIDRLIQLVNKNRM
jgi:arsenate reductase-like glutaredoxin family protein